MKLIIVRHGETDWNKQKIIQGQMGIKLNSTGKKQAEKIAEQLKNEKMDAIYSSKLARASETAEVINRYHNLKIIFSDMLSERCYGIYEGKPTQQKNEEMARSGIPKHKFKPSGGESCEEVQERAKKFLDSIIHKHKNETVLLVTHGRFIQELMLHITDAAREKEDEYEHGNTGMTMLEIDEDKNHKIHVLNYTGYLEK